MVMIMKAALGGRSALLELQRACAQKGTPRSHSVSGTPRLLPLRGIA